LKQSSDGGDFGSNKCKRGYGGVWQSLRLAEVWSQAVGFVLASVAVKMFSHDMTCNSLRYTTFILKFFSFEVSN
jgi:hypothetical protein